MDAAANVVETGVKAVDDKFPRVGDIWITVGVPGLEGTAFEVQDVKDNRVRFKGGWVGSAKLMMGKPDVWKLKKRAG